MVQELLKNTPETLKDIVGSSKPGRDLWILSCSCPSGQMFLIWKDLKIGQN